MEAARAAVKSQEDAYNAKTEELKAASESGLTLHAAHLFYLWCALGSHHYLLTPPSPSLLLFPGGVVSRNKAKVQLDAHLAEDPLPLRKAKITLGAAQKKADKARAPFQEKTEAAEAAR